MATKKHPPSRKPQDQAAKSVHPEHGPTINIYLAGGKVQSIPQVPPTPSNTKKAETQGEDNTPPWKKRLEISGFFVLLTYTVFTGFMTCANRKAAFAARDSADTASETMKTDQRAWVMIIPGTAPDPKEGQAVSIPVKVLNTGKTVARKVEIKIITKIMLNHESFDFSYAKAPTAITGVIFPNQPATDLNSSTSKDGKTYNLIRKAIGYIYGFADCALRNIGQDMGDASVGVPVIYQVLRRLFPDKAEKYVTFLIDNMRDERVLLGMMTGGQQYADYFCKPGREGMPTPSWLQ
jgi:hypothetical protein